MVKPRTRLPPSSQTNPFSRSRVSYPNRFPVASMISVIVRRSSLRRAAVSSGRSRQIASSLLAYEDRMACAMP